MFENIEAALCDELDRMNEKYRDGQEISAGDLEKADKVFHALKSAATYTAMKGYDGRSERSYRGRTSGRNMSRDGREFYPGEGEYPYRGNERRW